MLSKFVVDKINLHYLICTLLFFFQAAGKINKTGYLIIKSDKTRKQILNQADCIEKIRKLVFTASKKPDEPTEEDMQLKAKRYRYMYSPLIDSSFGRYVVYFGRI